MIRNILLTGGSGFLGSNILKKLLFNKYNVIVLVRKTSDLYRIKDESDCLKLFYVNNELDNLSELFQIHEIDTIIHTATEYGRGTLVSSVFMTNFIFPVKLIEEGSKKGLQYFINTDSFFGKEIFVSSSYLNHYTISKKYLLLYLNSCDKELKVINMRLEHIFGEFDSNSKFVTNILHQLLNETPEILLTEGTQKRDFIYVADVVEAYLKVIKHIDEIENLAEFEIGYGESISVREFVQDMLEISGSNSILKFGALPSREGEIQNSIANVAKLREIGWKPKYDLKSAISKVVEMENVK